jgi:hypothetical protein
MWASNASDASARTRVGSGACGRAERFRDVKKRRPSHPMPLFPTGYVMTEATSGALETQRKDPQEVLREASSAGVSLLRLRGETRRRGRAGRAPVLLLFFARSAGSSISGALAIAVGEASGVSNTFHVTRQQQPAPRSSPLLRDARERSRTNAKGRRLRCRETPPPAGIGAPASSSSSSRQDRAGSARTWTDTSRFRSARAGTRNDPTRAAAKRSHSQVLMMSPDLVC